MTKPRLNRNVQIVAKVVSLLLLYAASLAPAAGSVQRYTASVSIQIKASKPSQQETDGAMAALKRALLAKVVADQDISRRPRLEGMLTALNPDEFFVSGTLLLADSQVDKKNKVLTVVAQVDADSDAFNKLLDRPAAAEPAAKQYIAWVFAARRQASVKEYDPEVFNQVAKMTATGQTASASAHNGTAETETATLEKSGARSSGGVLRKSDDIDYTVAQEQRGRIDKALSSALVNRGFSPVPSSDLQANSNGKLKISMIMEDFKTASDLSDDSNALVMEAAVLSEVDYFATGTVTVNAKSRDSATGNTRISVVLDAQIYGFRKSRNSNRYIGTSIVASTGSRVVIAVGKDQTEAESKAIEEASILAGNVLCDQLRSRESK